MRTLPNDYVRCPGAETDGLLCVECSKCLRYTQRVTDNPRQSWTAPPLRFVDGKCPKFEGDKP